MRLMGLFLQIMGVGIILSSIPIRFTNPELTETQLFLKFWWIWLVGAATMLAGYWVWCSEGDKDED